MTVGYDSARRGPSAKLRAPFFVGTMALACLEWRASPRQEGSSARVGSGFHVRGRGLADRVHTGFARRSPLNLNRNLNRPAFARAVGSNGELGLGRSWVGKLSRAPSTSLADGH